jgi:hypothetical protein
MLQAETHEKLGELARAAKLTSSGYVQCLVAMAREAVVLERPIRNEQFAPRLRQLAAQLNHVRGRKCTSFSLDDNDMDAIREVQEALQLPRQHLVVEYAVQAAWITKPSGGDGAPEDPQGRKLFLARFHNVENSRALRSLPLPDELSLFDEEVSTKS